MFESTPLHYVASQGHLKIIEYLLKSGAEINAKTSNTNLF